MLSTNIILKNAEGMQIAVNPLGACWRSCLVPVNGYVREVLLGSSDELQYQTGKGKLGATCGRYAGRIASASYLDYALEANDGANTLHSGSHNFATKVWEVAEKTMNKVVFRLTSVDGENGFPGTLYATATYELTDDNVVTLTWEATSDKETVVNLTNHAYFNLNGDESGISGVEQYLKIAADCFVPVANNGIPTAQSKPLTPEMDFRREKIISKDLGKGEDQKKVGGLDHSYLIDSAALTPQAVISAKDYSLIMELLTNQKAIHVYSGQSLSGVKNRSSGSYENFSGIALETQAPPDSPNQRYDWVRLLPGETYRKQTKLIFISI